MKMIVLNHFLFLGEQSNIVSFTTFDFDAFPKTIYSLLYNFGNLVSHSLVTAPTL